MVKEQNPYVDIHISRESLEKSLEEVGILQKEHTDSYCAVSLKVEEYATYLKAEEIRKNYLQETKYDKYALNPPVEEEKLDTVKEKVKVKTLLR